MTAIGRGDGEALLSVFLSYLLETAIDVDVGWDGAGGAVEWKYHRK